MSERENIIVNKSFRFALEILKLYSLLIKQNEYILSKQMLQSGTSIGANIEEAVGAASKKDFKHKMNISLKEARETRYWLKLFDQSEIVNYDVKHYIEDATELIRILSAIVKSSNN